MKIFYGSDWGSKVNFVDEKNVMLGYDTDQCCCEYAGWSVEDKILSDTPNEREPKIIPELTNFVFDTSFFKEIGDCSAFDEGKMVVFRIHDGGKEKFIHLFNVHNGYYAHGFTFAAGDQGIREGVL